MVFLIKEIVKHIPAILVAFVQPFDQEGQDDALLVVTICYDNVVWNDLDRLIVVVGLKEQCQQVVVDMLKT